MAKNRVFTAYFYTEPAAAGGTGNIQWDINNYNKNSLLKSIAWDLYIRQLNAPFNNLPLDQNFTQNFHFTCNPVTTNILFSQTVENVVPPTAINNNGNLLMWRIPGQFKFDSFFIQNTLRFSYSGTNQDPLIAYRHYLNFICEIQDLE